MLVIRRTFAVLRRIERPWRLLGLMPLLLTGGCSPSVLLNALVPTSGYTATRDVAYANGPRHRLDVYVPNQPPPNAPVVVFFYGGNWQSGDKETYLFVGEALAAHGVIAVIPDYRVYPEVRFPAFVEDGAQAVRWAVDNAARLGGDPHRLFLMGHSAGAHIAALLSLDPRFLRTVGLDPRRAVHGMIGLAGPYDFLPLRSATLKDLFGAPERLPETQPITYASADAPPMLLVSGKDDGVVEAANSTRLAARVRAIGGRVDEIYYERVGHVSVVAALGSPLRFVAPVLDDTLAFIHGHP